MSQTENKEDNEGLSLTGSLARIFENSTNSDVTFLIGDEAAKVEVKAHKLILTSRSPVFRAMFNDENPISESNKVTIPDTDEATFVTFLRYLYVDELKELQSVDEVASMLYLAEKYMMPTMKPVCEVNLRKLLDVDTAFQMFNICTLYSLNEFREIVLRFMADQADECCKIETFFSQKQLLIEKFTESPHLCIAETNLLDAVLHWATNECNRQNLDINRENIRSVLGQILRNIRFMSIPEAELMEKFSNVLNAGEKKELNRLYNSNPVNMSSRRFYVRPRTGLGYQIIKIYQTLPSESIKDSQYALQLTTSDDIWLYGVSVFGPHYDVHDYICVDIEVKADGDHHFKSTRRYDKEDFSDEIVNMMFVNPVRLKHKVSYTFLLTIFGSGTDEYFLIGDEMDTSVDFHGTTLSFSDTVDPKYDLYKGRGQFPRFFLQGMNEAYASSKCKTKKKKHNNSA